MRTIANVSFVPIQILSCAKLKGMYMANYTLFFAFKILRAILWKHVSKVFSLRRLKY